MTQLAVFWPLTLAGMMAASGTVRTADLEVEVRGVRPRAGEVHAAVFDRAEAFALDTEIRAMISSSGEITAGVFTGQDEFPRPPVDRLSVAPTTRTVQLKFSGLEPGEYAVGVYQAHNTDGPLY